MRLKHYLLLALAVLLIAFFQPFVVFLGNFIVIVGALAYVYSDLTPEAQDAYEQKLSDFFARIRSSLRGRGAARAQARMQKRSGIFRMLRRKKVVPSGSPMVIEEAIEAEINLPDSSEKIDNSEQSAPSANDHPTSDSTAKYQSKSG